MTATAVRPSRPAPESTRIARVWPALARREAGAMLRHPMVWIGVLASSYALWTFNRGDVPHLGGYSSYVGLGLAPLSGAALLVAHLHTSRAHRHGTAEIENPAPAHQGSRTVGHLVGALAVLPVAAVIVAAYMVYLYAIGGTGSPNIGELLVGPLVVAVAATAGVAAGTWFPSRFGGLIGLGAVAAVQIGLQDAPGTLHWFSWWHTVLWYNDFALWTRPTAAHIAYLAGATMLICALAPLRHGLEVAPGVVAAAGLVLLAGGGVVQAQPPSDAEVEQIWSRVVSPETVWVTTERDGVTYHLLPSYQRWIDWWDDAIAGTVAPIPATERPALVVEQRPHAFPSQLLDEFRGESDPAWLALMERANELYFGTPVADPWPIQVGESLVERMAPSLAIAAAIRAVALPLAPVEVEGRLYTEAEIEGYNYVPTEPTEYVSWPGQERGLPRPQLGDHWTYEFACDAEGQAREVVAAWLAAQASAELAERYHTIRQDGLAYQSDYGSEGLTQFGRGDEPPVPAVLWDAIGWIQSNGYGGASGAGGVLGSPTATDLAAQLLDLPDDVVAATLREHWDDWTDPATSVQAIITAFDLEPPPTPPEWIERSGEDPADYADSIAAYPHWLGEDRLGDQPHPTCP